MYSVLLSTEYYKLHVVLLWGSPAVFRVTFRDLGSHVVLFRVGASRGHSCVECPFESPTTRLDVLDDGFEKQPSRLPILRSREVAVTLERTRTEGTRRVLGYQKHPKRKRKNPYIRQ